MKEKAKKIETLELKSKKKKTAIIVGVIVLLVIIIFVSIASSVLKVQKSKIYQAKQSEKYKKKELKIMQQPEFKENWAISIENKLAEMNKKMSEMDQKFKQNQLEIFKEIKNIISEGAKNNEQKIESLKTSLQKEIQSFKKEVNEKIEKQNEKIESLSILVDTLKMSKSAGGPGKEKEIVIGSNLLPTIPVRTEEGRETNVTAKTPEVKPKAKQKNIILAIPEEKESPEEVAKKLISEISQEKVKSKKKKEPRKLVLMDINTEFNKKLIGEQQKIEKEEASKKKEEGAPAHVTIGFTKAYLVTGIHAPVFSEGTEEPLPVLLEAEGRIVMANNVRGNIGKCFLIGSAKGEMNSQVAKVRLEKISCLLDGGQYRLEGSIRGWVIDGKSGMPGLNGELIHKNGAWMARTFVAGFLETFSEAITTSNVQAIDFGGSDNAGYGTNENGSVKSAIGSNAASAVGSGISEVFKKIGDYYLKMAQQIFPVIEVRGGRTVDILLLGGEDFSVVKNTPLDVNYLEEKIKEKERNRLNESKKKANITTGNPFTRAAMLEKNDSEQNGAIEDDITNGKDMEPKEGSFSSEEKPVSEDQIMKIRIPE